jgi:hypothetical protein
MFVMMRDLEASRGEIKGIDLRGEERSAFSSFSVVITRESG